MSQTWAIPESFTNPLPKTEQICSSPVLIRGAVGAPALAVPMAGGWSQTGFGVRSSPTPPVVLRFLPHFFSHFFCNLEMHTLFIIILQQGLKSQLHICSTESVSKLGHTKIKHVRGDLFIYLFSGALFVKRSSVHKVCKELLQDLTAPSLLSSNMPGGFWPSCLTYFPSANPFQQHGVLQEVPVHFVLPKMRKSKAIADRVRQGLHQHGLELISWFHVYGDINSIHPAVTCVRICYAFLAVKQTCRTSVNFSHDDWSFLFFPKYQQIKWINPFMFLSCSLSNNSYENKSRIYSLAEVPFTDFFPGI